MGTYNDYIKKIPVKSPVSATTVVKLFNCSKQLRLGFLV